MKNYTNAKIIHADALQLAHKTRVIALGVMAIASIFMFSLAYKARADTLTTQMSLGSRGANVSNLQSFLATNPRIYPEALVTGYYGGLTRSAVMQFQLNYNISPVGNVGPQTLAKMNSVISSGLGLDISAPIIANVALSVGTNSATVNWTTDTYAQGQVYYDTQPIQWSETSLPMTSPGISGQTMTNTSLTNASQSITLPNLSANTTYYYVVKATDVSGNVSLTWPATFHTNQ